MVYKKLISCLLIAVLLLQVVSVGGVASAETLTPLDQLNMEREMYIESDEGTTVTHVQNLLEQQDLITLPEDYEALNDNQKYEIARGMVMLLPLEFSYENNNQANYVFDLVYHLISLPKQTELSTLQYSINLVYSLLAEWSTYFPNVGKPDWTQAGNHYMNLTGADLPMFVSYLMFYNIIFMDSSDPTQFNSQLEFMVSKISEYKELNGALDLSSMEASLDNLYGMYDFIQMHVIFNPNPNIQPFVFNMEKMSTIQNDPTKKSELAQWMIDHKPQNGYETVSEVQKEFDAFFNKDTTLTKYNELKKEADRGNSNDFIQDLIVLLHDEQFIANPDFKMLSVKDQEDIAVYLLDIEPPTNAGYEKKEDVEFLVQVALKALEVIREINGPNAIAALDEFYNKQAERVNHFKEPDPEGEYYRFINTYLTSSEMDKWMTKYRYAIRLKGKESISRVVKFTDTAVERTPYLNQALTEAEVLESLEHLRSIQKGVEEYNSVYTETPLGTFPLDVSKLDNLTSEEQKQLADHMLNERPVNGYASFEAIQTAFNKFFPDDNESDPLTVLNAAKSNSNIAAMRMAMEDPDLGITLPNGYGALSLQVRDFIAGFLIDYVNKDYKNKEQVQYMIELGVLAQSVWEQRELSVLRNKLDLLAQQLVNGPNHFNDQQTYVLRSLGQQHLERSKVDKGVLAYNYLHLVAFERLEGVSKGDIVDPNIVLNLLSMPIDSFEQATSIPRMDQWLDVVMKNQIKGEAFFSKYKFNLRGALDLSKRAELSPEGQKELAEWVLNEQDSYEDVGNLQYVFNRFFTAPNVKGNDINNTLTGLDNTMEISYDNKLHWIDVAFIQKMDLSGNKTVWVRYKAISDELPGRAVKFVFTQNGDSNTDNGNGSTPNPGGDTGGGSSTTTPVTSVPAPTTKQEQIVVDVNGTNGTNLTKTPITRTTETNGTIKDLVKMTEAIAKESVEKAKQLNMNTARIVIPDTKDSVSETRIELPKAAVKELNDGSLKLEISTENVVISVPTNSIAGFDQDLYFRVVPLKKESERKEVEERAKKGQLIQQVAPNTNVRVLARPVEIDTNMQSREVTLTLPLRDSLPTDPAARQQALDNLAIYIEHSDGTKELIQGKLVKLADNSEGIEFPVTKFSTFTLVVVDGLKASQSTHQPYIQGFGMDFRPDAFVTRAQMAAMLARNLPTEAAAGSVNSVSYKDVSATHWATSVIQKAQSAGIMNGMSNTQFAPEGSITRAQMATIAYRWMQQQASATTVNGTAVSFTDVSVDLWAADAIAYVQSAGLMVGYNNGTFKPDSKLTRAEAVKVLNLLFNRTPLTGEVTPTFSDVPTSHWAYAEIEAAAQK
ncbi:S-layer homology domain-containing protein [Paenibacillus sp. UASWS1643]|uniref:S-layer homology domain-containing protein n=1 Tax=Paenibacillus sp. UASWS1643 TaxID=2580422 RepID=UPI001239C97D|nr:S-layer homology domain-containing protein [Paenibacillus sp. UASWS1643]KAA8753466.1 S-layer homology domain-containing protein [Paenibacillus sp. UASWS1643]